MKDIIIILVKLAVIAITLVACATTQNLKVDLAIINTTVIDPESRAVRPNQTVLIKESRIISVNDAGFVDFDASTSIDGEGRFVIPGLMDMHAHTAVGAVVENSFKLMIANGITGIRDMSSDCWEPKGDIFLCIDEMRSFGKQIESGVMPGPRLLKLASPIVQSAPTWQLPENPDPAYSPITENQGRDIVSYLANRGVDLIKVYDYINPKAYRAILAQASASGLEVSGHIPIYISTLEASNLGQRTIEHARDLLTDCSTYGAAYRSAHMAILNDVEGAQWPEQETLRIFSVSTFDPVICANVMEAMVQNNTYYVPTHGTREFDIRARETKYREDPRLRYVSKFLVNDWQTDLKNTAAIPDSKIGAYRNYYAHGLQITKLAIESGVPVMIGTDANDTMMIPGFAVHDEMLRFDKAGVSPMDILRAATTVPASYLGREEDFGGVSAGKLADLVLLDENPLDDIGNSTTINTVIFGGRVYDRESLDKLLAEVELDR